MIQIFLDGKPAIPRDNATIKLTSENPYFTKSATYTYEVEFPDAIAENRALFGPINRMDVTKRQHIYTASLIVDAVPVLSGTAHITSVTETAVKLQLLGETAAYNYGNKMEKTYIDMLDLGDWYSVTWPDETLPEGHSMKGNCGTVFRRTFGKYWNEYPRAISKEGMEYQQALLYGDSLPWTAYQTVNDTDSRRANLHCFLEYGNINPEFKTITGYARWMESPVLLHVDYTFCCQPFIWFMAELIAKATGFKLRREDNALYNDPFLKRVFIANTSNSIQVKHCLPHWTVNEWWTQVEQTFGVVLDIDPAIGQIKLTKRDSHYSKLSQIYEIKNVVDEYNSDMDDETIYDISSSNVGYADFDCDPADRLSEYILTNAVEDYSYADKHALTEWLISIGKEEAVKNYKNYIFRCADGHSYIVKSGDPANGWVIEVDSLQNRIVKAESNDIDIELKFVPCKIGEVGTPYETEGSRNSIFADGRVMGVLTTRCLHREGESRWIHGYEDEEQDSIDIEALLSGEEEETTAASDDVIYIALTESRETGFWYFGLILDDFKGHDCHFSYHCGITSIDPHHKTKIGDTGEIIRGVSLSLNHFDDIDTLGDAAIGTGSSNIDVNVRHCIRFIADRLPSPGSIFLIRNRKYVCEKIEADISTTGLKKLMTGYFYEIDL